MDGESPIELSTRTMGHVENDESWHPWSPSQGKKGSHGDLFLPNERKNIITSTVCWTAMATLLVGLSFTMGPLQVLKLHGIPYWVRMEFSKGRTNTRNRDYGWIYNIGTHVPNTQFMKAIACLKASAAYWRGNKDRESLQRV
ncbi:putative acyl-lipid Delta(12)-acetylenase [Helianthus annuus]|uniref:Acyl-lipid Delta(12)-acetylenase n=1 Tax=Helianthus annuus TaxID=4232 RepID=A0A251TDD2_HELAN|nr:putative acyl-lipid Delta(12)-acetylenase [Helianthus annuus]KAJ0560770.1 putative acyl-lipid Delta(12)-acetylenase [Helianthus annuus]KAJ0567190.1 putative acyl-lipid Delta(12)-acetylenase [Helianthus annuus]KAJ0573805.1 putative acyl-lipid Delta(12)-acetylenase [Helianthus annuus]KAJ0738139.1 putative acyl-lipid Delta(12)-acetylenase [Helianthus annuus]